jgi:DNA polymerase-3 subunit delta
MAFGAGSNDEKIIASTIGVNPFFVKDYLAAAKNYNYSGIEKILLLLHQYNLRSIGIHDAGTEDASLLKELVIKILN